MIAPTEEMGRAELDNAKRTKRLGMVAAGIRLRPWASLPVAMGNDAALEGAYRLLKNPFVEPEQVLRPHIEATAERVRSERRVYAASDTTEFRFGGDGRHGLGPLQNGGQGFLAHVCLAVTGDGSRLPLGVLGFETIIRPEKPKKRRGTKKSRQAADRESLKWQRVAMAAEAAVGDGAELVHVMDREADIYDLFAALKAKGHSFIVRVAQDRAVEEGLMDAESLKATVAKAKVRFTREVPLSRRKRAAKPHARRAERTAVLSVAGATLRIKRPQSADKSLPENLSLGFVHVFESTPPEGEKPVEWLLVTTEAIETQTDLERVIDGYRTRWVVEEFFKALKTGCAMEQSQLESLKSLLNLLSIKLPVAAQLVALRGQAELNERALARELISPLRLEVLRAMTGLNLPADPTAAEALGAIAKLGGHIKNNGAPGWQVLSRGLDDLMRYEEAWRVLAAQRSDQS